MTQPDLPLWEIVQTYHPVARGFHALFAEAGLTPNQFGVLAVLRDEEGTGRGSTQAELARQVLLRPQSMGELISALVTRGLVEREGPGGRGRATGLRLTAAGRASLAEAEPRVEAFNAPEALGLTAEESATLSALLRRVRDALDGAVAGRP
ncbi:MarR family winged helix-turn-helix transcriptional regulator [Actinomycetospora aeridis]|uniref:MarR family winged helix-turn-helix transcriptional regulator n=1 Tax=Actinomycetospora aeridis TaxID=3129231 RepID=A0ABU8NG51_9PSEU